MTSPECIEKQKGPARRLHWCGIVAFYTLIAVVLFWPIIREITNRLPIGMDAGATPWRMWWIKTAIVDLKQSPYWCDSILYPHGVSLFYYNLTLLYGVLALPFTTIRNSMSTYVAASNIFTLLTFVLGSIACSILCYRASRSHIGALVGGFLFGFSPMRFSEYDGLNLMSSYWIPMLFLAVLGFHGDKPQWRFSACICAGLCFLGAFLTSLTAMFLMGFSIPFLAVIAFSRAENGFDCFAR